MPWSLPKSASYMIRFMLLTSGFALATYGLIGWTDGNFDMTGVWLYDNGWRIHHLHLVILGVGLIPPAMWELFALELQRHRRRAQAVDAAPSEDRALAVAEATGDG